MKNFFLCLIIVLSLIMNRAAAQGLSRANGIGLRGSFWKMGDNNRVVLVTSIEDQNTVDVGGFGGWLYFFSRLYNNWVFRVDMGAVAAGIHVEQTGINSEIVDISAILTLLMGVQYDLLSIRLSTRIQPYFSAGAGPYWHQAINVENNLLDEDISTAGESTFGGYVGGGLNIPISSFFGLNFDIKYHYVKFNTAKDLSGIEFGMGFCFMFGKKREMFRIKDIRLVVTDIYPAYYQFYNTYPLALVTVENTAGYPIEVNVRSRLLHYSARAKESGFIKLASGETKDLPATAVFGPEIRERVSRGPAVLNIEIEGRAGSTLNREISTQLTVHTRNSWNGEIDKLVFFVTPEDQQIINLSRYIVNKLEHIDPVQSKNIIHAAAIFNELKRRKIQYQHDPNIPFYKDDRVQFAAETLELESGDCDDLVVLYSSLLESVGINTAFVQVINSAENLAHLFILVDSGVEEEQAVRISSNEKRYVIREGISGQETVWIPIETTLISGGFEEAWNSGALYYLQEAIINGGLDKGGVKIVNVD
jgi:hypothetical protein